MGVSGMTSPCGSALLLCMQLPPPVARVHTLPPGSPPHPPLHVAHMFICQSDPVRKTVPGVLDQGRSMGRTDCTGFGAHRGRRLRQMPRGAAGTTGGDGRSPCPEAGCQGGYVHVDPPFPPAQPSGEPASWDSAAAAGTATSAAQGTGGAGANHRQLTVLLADLWSGHLARWQAQSSASARDLSSRHRENGPLCRVQAAAPASAQGGWGALKWVASHLCGQSWPLLLSREALLASW